MSLMLRTAWSGAVLFAVVTLSGGAARSGRPEALGWEAPADTGCPAANVRNTGRAILCARVIDGRTGVGVPGGSVDFERNGGGSMHGAIRRDGRFSINVPGGHGILTISWSCRRSVRWEDTLTVPAGQGISRTFEVAVTPADTLCRREFEDRSDTSHAAVARWISRGLCFAIALGQWNPPLRGANLPRQVRLDSAQSPRRAAHASQPLRYEPPDGSRWRRAGWRPLQGDSIEIYWGGDFVGIGLALGVQADSLAGRGMWTDDIVITDSLGFLDRARYPNGPASARRVSCE